MPRSASGHDALAVAARLQEIARERGDTLTPLQIIKLVYLCHGWMLGLHGRPLIRESVEAWTYGPVIPSLYQALKQYRSSPVTEPIQCDPAQFSAEEESVIREVYENYGDLDGVQLSSLTHHRDSPWAITWKRWGRSGTISNDVIEHHFAQLAHDQPSASP